jgi:hypothetical protein
MLERYKETKFELDEKELEKYIDYVIREPKKYISINYSFKKGIMIILYNIVTILNNKSLLKILHHPQCNDHFMN